ncbi:hypothetical protein KCU59_g7, partial [Aureobasidium melanogenum]
MFSINDADDSCCCLVAGFYFLLGDTPILLLYCGFLPPFHFRLVDFVPKVLIVEVTPFFQFSFTCPLFHTFGCTGFHLTPLMCPSLCVSWSLIPLFLRKALELAVRLVVFEIERAKKWQDPFPNNFELYH